MIFVLQLFKIIALTTPGKQRSVSILGPSKAVGGELEESDDESGEEGIEEFTWPILAVIIYESHN